MTSRLAGYVLAVTRFRFHFTTPYRVVAALFGVTPHTTMVEVTDEELNVRFGPWVLQTPIDNIIGCRSTGPFSYAKTAGPAHLSLADHGLTCATNGERGLCVRFAEPVPCIDPFGRIRHPAVTVTVERVDDLRQLLEPDTPHGEQERIEAEARGVAAESPWTRAVRVLRRPSDMALAAWHYLGALPDVTRSYDVSADPAPWLDDPAHVEDLQPISEGTGPVLERIYRARLADVTLAPERLMELITEDLNRTCQIGVADFVDQRVTDGRAGEGSEYRIEMPGPWDPAVRVIDRTPTSVRLATLSGHMEAGHIEMRTSSQHGQGLVFEIRSVARTADHLFSLLYNRLRLPREMQLYMWVDVCRNVARLSGGRLDGKIQLRTIEHRT